VVDELHGRVRGQVAEAVARAVMEMLEWLNERS
jgi:hypothetical protein